MIDKPGKSAVDNHLEELRRQGIEALRRFNGTAGRLNLYKRYLAPQQILRCKTRRAISHNQRWKMPDIHRAGAFDHQSSGEA
jgi:hypothetical protein